MTTPTNIDPKDIRAHWAKYQGDIRQDGERRKALVPGCGRGVDVLLFASFGYDAMMPMAWSAAPRLVEACKKEEKENRSRYRVRDEKVGRGKVTFVQGDFFDDTWLKEIGVPRNGFEVIYDYTVCILTAAVGLHSVIASIFSPLV
ncbi:Thiopurine S-methyltransferase [Metarhizium rileyi]|uniref:Thiopurine S-methyltransferase n=1 Tax=Metarhizium rileyi (strain RCEF 4871) TaxID=1649241 RepID=A0A166VTW8_METRR|nr:Thiopurine S-methyltransferase [Metarhizium rileyi RCEF 4871]